MNIQYIGDDNRIHSLGDSNALQHWKYIKKIPFGKGFRYFYSMDEIRAYEEAQKSTRRALADDEVPAELYIHRVGKEKEYKKIADEAKKNSYKRFKKDVKDTWDFAKPQKPSTLDKKLYREYSKTSKNRAKRIEDIDNRYDKLNKMRFGTTEEGGRISAREEYYNRLNKKEQEKYNKRNHNVVRYERLASSSAKKVSDIRNSSNKQIDKGRSTVEKKLNKAKKTTKSEVKGVKRATNAIRNKGNNFYDAHNTAPKSYSTYDRKKKKFGKNKKTGRIERTMIAAYRKTHPYE